MQRPTNVADALDTIHRLLYTASLELEEYANEAEPEFLANVKDCVLNAHLLATWLQDRVDDQD